jgi:hypothetical protein
MICTGTGRPDTALPPEAASSSSAGGSGVAEPGSGATATDPPARVVNDFATALDVALSLASELVSGGPWWQEAKAHHLVLLAEVLYKTLEVRFDNIHQAIH